MFAVGVLTLEGEADFTTWLSLSPSLSLSLSLFLFLLEPQVMQNSHRDAECMDDRLSAAQLLT